MDTYMGAIVAFGFNYAPANDFLPCDGRSMSVSANQALYALIGTTYGGDGVSTFNLPDLGNIAAIGYGQGTNLSNYTFGQKGGSDTAQLTAANLPAHTHTVNTVSGVAAGGDASTTNPQNAYYGILASTTDLYNTAATQNVTMAPNVVNSSYNASAGQPLSIVQPNLVVNYCICVNGLYPVHP